MNKNDQIISSSRILYIQEVHVGLLKQSNFEVFSILLSQIVDQNLVILRNTDHS